MKRYRIYTENKNLDEILKILCFTEPGFTIIHITGYWKGKEEKSVIIEILTDFESGIKFICAEIKKCNQQESVLYTVEPVKTFFV